MQERRERMGEELRKEERERDLLRELERRLKGGDRSELEEYLRQLDRLVESWPEGHTPRLLIERAVGGVRTRDPIRAGSDVSRSRSAIEGEISTLRGVLSRESFAE